MVGHEHREVRRKPLGKWKYAWGKKKKSERRRNGEAQSLEQVLALHFPSFSTPNDSLVRAT